MNGDWLTKNYPCRASKRRKIMNNHPNCVIATAISTICHDSKKKLDVKQKNRAVTDTSTIGEVIFLSILNIILFVKLLRSKYSSTIKYTNDNN